MEEHVRRSLWVGGGFLVLASALVTAYCLYRHWLASDIANPPHTSSDRPLRDYKAKGKRGGVGEPQR